MPALRETETILLQPLLKLRGLGEHPNSRPHLEPIASLLADQACIFLVTLVVAEHRCRYPELSKLDAARTLVLGSMFQPEKFRCPTCVVAINVGERDNIKVVARRGSEILSKRLREVASLVVLIRPVPLIAEIKEDFLPVGEVQEDAVRVPQRKERKFRHRNYPVEQNGTRAGRPTPALRPGCLLGSH